MEGLLLIVHVSGWLYAELLCASSRCANMCLYYVFLTAGFQALWRGPIVRRFLQKSKGTQRKGRSDL